MVSPAGWYADPAGGMAQRYFDGDKWTDSYAPIAQYASVVAVGTNHSVHAVLTLLSCGAWLPMWIIIAILESRRVTVRH